MEVNTTPKSQRRQSSLSPHFVYMLQCANGAYYTGYTTNIEKRLAIHNAGRGARYTRAHLPVSLLASWSFPSKGEALRAERAIKRLSRGQKERLIEQNRQGSPVLPNWLLHT
jgi:putative endonuclease